MILSLATFAGTRCWACRVLVTLDRALGTRSSHVSMEKNITSRRPVDGAKRENALDLVVVGKRDHGVAFVEKFLEG